MFSSLEIQNIRCFKNLSISPLSRLNLLAGRNNCGKTTVLESVFLLLAPNNPEIGLRLNFFRGIDKLRAEPEQLWGWLFYERRFDMEASIGAVLTNGEKRCLKLALVDAALAGVISTEKLSASPKDNGTVASTSSRQKELLMEYSNGEGAPVISTAKVSSGKISIERGELSETMRGIFVTTQVQLSTENAERFGRIEAVGRENEILEALQILEPRLRRLAVVLKGDMPLIHGDIGAKELIPLALMGEGLVRLLSILLAITDAPGGVVLIDEIENGLHYSVLEKSWQAIHTAAEKADAQVFATTHSFDCIRAAHAAFASQESQSFQFFRLGAGKRGIEAMPFDRESLASAISNDLEVR